MNIGCSLSTSVSVKIPRNGIASTRHRAHLEEVSMSEAAMSYLQKRQIQLDFDSLMDDIENIQIERSIPKRPQTAASRERRMELRKHRTRPVHRVTRESMVM